MARRIRAASPCRARTRSNSRAACSAVLSAKARPGRASRAAANTDRPASARALAEQHGAHARILHVDLRGLLDADVNGAVDRRTRQHAREPALEMGELRDVLSLALPVAGP